MSRNINEHNLSRYIPTNIKQRIRYDAGFGCVMCGSAFYQYEHIEPEWHDAKEHDPEKMTLLCPDHHTKVSNKIISKSQVKKAKLNPVSKKLGMVKDKIEKLLEKKEFYLGSNLFEGSGAFVMIGNKPIIWFEDPEADSNSLRISCVFYNHQGNQIAYINRNEYIALVDRENFDFECSATRLLIKYQNEIILKFNRSSEKIFKIERISSFYDDARIYIDAKENLVIGTYPSEKIFDHCRISGLGMLVQGCKYIGKFCNEIDKVKYYYKLLYIQICLVLFGKNVYAYNGSYLGSQYGQYIFFKDGLIAGKCINNKVYLLTDEFIGFFKDGFIGMNTDTYNETGEPIWIDPNDKGSAKIRNFISPFSYDLSYRLFGIINFKERVEMQQKSMKKPYLDEIKKYKIYF